MKFKINNSEWTIKEVDEAIINNEEKNNYTLGLTFYKTHEIWLLNNNEGIIRTLKHELMHVWLWEYGHSQDDEKQYRYEDVCEIVACSNDFINEIVEQYMQSKNVCHVENNFWDNLTKAKKDELLKELKNFKIMNL